MQGMSVYPSKLLNRLPPKVADSHTLLIDNLKYALELRQIATQLTTIFSAPSQWRSPII